MQHADMNEQQNVPSHVRLKELQSIPDNQKTEAQWDEIIELEIALAQGGRPNGGGGHKPQGAGHQAKKHIGKTHAGGGSPAKKPQRKFHKKPPKPATAQ
jgi:hypothetical protein